MSLYFRPSWHRLHNLQPAHTQGSNRNARPRNEIRSEFNSYHSLWSNGGLSQRMDVNLKAIWKGRLSILSKPRCLLETTWRLMLASLMLFTDGELCEGNYNSIKEKRSHRKSHIWRNGTKINLLPRLLPRGNHCSKLYQAVLLLLPRSRYKFTDSILL